MRTIKEIQKDVHEWSMKTFVNQSINSKFSHLKDEINELGENLYDGEEMADCVILLMSIAELANVDLQDAVERKFEKNKSRIWSEPDERGVYKHIE